MRDVAADARRLLEQSSQGDDFLLFVEIAHPDIEVTIRLVRDSYDYQWDGKTWAKSWFELDLLSDNDGPPQAKFAFPNVDRAAVMMLADVVNPARIALFVVPASYFDLSADPRTVLSGVTASAVFSARHLFLTDVSIDAIECTGTLRSWDYRTESWPDLRATQNLMPGAFMQ